MARAALGVGQTGGVPGNTESNRHLMVRGRWPLLSILLLVTLAIPACSWIAPSRPWSAGYVIMENGNLVAKLVCGEFSSVQVEQDGASTASVVWTAQSTGSGAAASLPLLQTDIRGYTIKSKGEVDRDENVFVTYERTDAVLGGSVEFVPSSLKEDEVAFAGGVVRSSKFYRMSDADFGCMR